ncbi:MAG: sugar phosphate isomerase/epimerase [Anaerolineae bacterium]|nr:sugar phosphate isomerase/epimerase [Anaerolineae bacterium]
MNYGVCADPKYGPVLAEAGFDFIELHVQNNLKTEQPEEAFVAELARIQASPLMPLAANCFVPGHLKITGPAVNWDALAAYAAEAFERAQMAGIRSIVFGSGGARAIPDGFDRDEAWQQLVRFGKLIGPLAQARGVTVVVEPLNVTQGACNVLTSVGESGRYVRDVNHPNVRLLVDAYHWGLDGDSYDDIVEMGPLLHHVHIATVANRMPPGFEPCDFTAFFSALKEARYDGPISIEAAWEDLERDAVAAHEHLVGLVTDAGL